MIESEIQEFPRGLVDVIARAHNRFRRIQYGEGFWWAELESNATMDAEFILMTHFLGARDDTVWRGVARDIRNYQRTAFSSAVRTGD